MSRDEAKAGGGARGGRRQGELTVDELAARTGMTVRNVRAYGSRGLIPPPRLVGRTGYYGAEHVARLTLVREMLDQGYTLAAAERMLLAAPGSGVQALGLYHALMSPGEATAPEVIEPETLAELAGVPHDPDLVARVVDLGLAQWGTDGSLVLSNPALVRAGLEVIAAGVPAERVLELVPQLRGHAAAVAGLFVALIRDSVWGDFVEAGMPEGEWARMQEVVERLVPLAGRALLSAFQESLGGEVAAAMEEDLGAAVGGAPSGRGGPERKGRASRGRATRSP